MSHPRRALARLALVAVLTAAALASSAGAAWADPVLATAGDIACKTAPVTSGSTCHYGETADLIPATPSAKAASTVASPAATDVLVLGDVQYECGDLPFFTSRYGPTWGQFKAITQPVIGNHEYDTAPGTTTCDPGTTTPAKGYFDYFNGVGVQTGPAGDRSKGYYSYDLGTWHIVVLNSNCTIVSCSAGSAQETFLRQDLAAHPAVCTLAAWHHPRFSSSNAASSSTQPLWQDLYDAHADLVLVGHEHFYERFARLGRTGTPADKLVPVADANGLREFIVGSGGRSHKAFGTIRPNSQVRNNTAFGILKLTLHPGSYDWLFVPESGATFTDSGTDRCSGATATDTTPPAAPTGVSATAASSAVTVSWTASTDPSGITGYRIFRAPAGGARAQIDTVGAVTSFRDPTVSPSTSYDYTVRAVDGAGLVSDESAVASVTTPAAATGTGATVTVSPTADAYVQDGFPDKNYGAVNFLRVHSSAAAYRSYLTFDTSGVAGTITSAKLRLWATDASPDGGRVHVVAPGSWSEASITFNTSPPLTSASIAGFGAVSVSTWAVADVTSAVKGGASSFGIETPSTNSAVYDSREGTNKPQLVITTAPA